MKTAVTAADTTYGKISAEICIEAETVPNAEIAEAFSIIP
jgi:hypothetical protein